jgi:hypothetical protein
MAQSNPNTIVQSVLISRRIVHEPRTAQLWLMMHNFKTDLDIKPKTYRARQIDPRKFVPGSFKTIILTDGVKAVVGRLKK